MVGTPGPVLDEGAALADAAGAVSVGAGGALPGGDGGTCTTGEPSGVGDPGSATTSGSVPLMKVASCTFPRGANAVFVAGEAVGMLPFGGPPQIPRCGFLHAIAPVHGWRIA